MSETQTNIYLDRRSAVTAQIEATLEEITGDEVEGEKPSIELRTGERDRVARESVDALKAHGVPLYRRGGALVRIGLDDDHDGDGIRRPAGARTITRATTAWLSVKLSQAAHFTKPDDRAKSGARHVEPPSHIPADITALSDELPIPPLRGIARHPIIRRDGSVSRGAGYDSATGLLLDYDPAAFPAPPEHPAPEDAAYALARLRHVVRHFPFDGDVAESVALSALVTAVLRPVLPTAPLHAFDAPTPGSGKSLLCHGAAILATGEPAPAAQIGRSDEETEKRLDASLLAGDPVLLLDNVERPLSGEKLCSMVTEPVVQIRPLGVSEVIKIPTSATLFATGNNLVIAGDMTRRVLVSRLDPGMERPELRTFDQDFLADMRAQRGELVRAVLTLVRAYIEAGRPAVCQGSMGSFDTWESMVRAPLVWAGASDPAGSMDSLRSADPEMEALRAVVGALRDRFAGSFTAKDAAAAADDNGTAGGDLHDALSEVAAGRSGAISSRSLGRYLEKHRDRVIDGLFIAHAGTRQRRTLWEVRRA